VSRRVVFDTSTLVGAALRPASVPYQALVEVFRRWDLCVGEQTLAELDRVLGRAKFDRYLSVARRRAFAALIRRRSLFFVVEDEHRRAVRPPCRDPHDDEFLALAIAAGADVIVSSDDDLLVLHPWRKIPVLAPATFLERSAASNSR
jgi:uncharacterized protein